MTTAASTDAMLTTDAKLRQIIAEQEEIFVRRQPKSQHLAEQAQQYLAGGVTSSWQITVPQPVWLSRGRGSRVWDVDGNEYVDLHGGYGAALAGDAHPAIAKAIIEPGPERHPLRPADPGRDHGGARARPQVRPPRAGVSPTPAPKPPWTPST